MRLGDRISALRKEKKISQNQLGEMIGVKNYVISDWEKGRSEPSLEMVAKLAQALGVPPSRLLDEDGGVQEALGAVPIYRLIRCGNERDGTGVHGEVVENLPFDRKAVELGVFGIIAQGDSMWGPPAWIQDGYRVLFNPCAPDFLPPGKVACLTVEGYADPLCKRIRIEPTGLVLASDNPAYPPIFIRSGQKVIVHGI